MDNSNERINEIEKQEERIESIQNLVRNKLSFSSFDISKYIEHSNEVERKGQPVSWGENNNYPNYLYKLLECSSVHNAVIQKKKQLTSGGGWDMKNQSPEMIEFFENGDSQYDLNDILDHLTDNKYIFNGVFFKIFWGVGVAIGEKYIAKIEVIPFDMCRVVTISDDSYKYEWVQVNEDWMCKNRYETKTYHTFNPDLSAEYPIQIYYWRDMSGGRKYKYYPKQDYISGETQMLSEGSINRFHFSAISNGFSINKFITLVDGKPGEEEKREIVRSLRKSFEGPENANKNFFYFADSKESAPVIESLTDDNNDKKYIQLREEITNGILIAHGVVNPALFGVRIPGSLGTSKELIDSLNIFQAVNIDPVQASIEELFNYFLEVSGIEGSMKINKFVIPKTLDITLNDAIAIVDNSSLDYDQKISVLKMGGFSDDQIENLLKNQVPSEDTTTTVEATVQETSLNGSQVESLLQIINQVSVGVITIETAKPFIQAAFPSIKQDYVDRMLAGVKPVSSVDPNSTIN